VGVEFLLGEDVAAVLCCLLVGCLCLRAQSVLQRDDSRV
jgi:hypothetical protein